MLTSGLADVTVLNVSNMLLYFTLVLNSLSVFPTYCMQQPLLRQVTTYITQVTAVHWSVDMYNNSSEFLIIY